MTIHKAIKQAHTRAKRLSQEVLVVWEPEDGDTFTCYHLADPFDIGTYYDDSQVIYSTWDN